MKCPKCGKMLKPGSSKCRHCSVRIVRQSDKMARKMVVNSRIAMACGGLLVLISLILAINGVYVFAASTCVIGVALVGIGKMMD